MKNFFYSERRLIGFAGEESDAKPKPKLLAADDSKILQPENGENGGKEKTERPDPREEFNKRRTQLEAMIKKFQDLSQRLKPEEIKQHQESLNRNIGLMNEAILDNQNETIKKALEIADAVLKDMHEIVGYQTERQTKDVIDIARKDGMVTLTVPLAMRNIRPTNVWLEDANGKKYCAGPVQSTDTGWKYQISAPKGSGIKAIVTFEDGESMTPLDLDETKQVRDAKSDGSPIDIPKIEKAQPPASAPIDYGEAGETINDAKEKQKQIARNALKDWRSSVEEGNAEQAKGEGVAALNAALNTQTKEDRYDLIVELGLRDGITAVNPEEGSNEKVRIQYNATKDTVEYIPNEVIAFPKTNNKSLNTPQAEEKVLEKEKNADIKSAMDNLELFLGAHELDDNAKSALDQLNAALGKRMTLEAKNKALASIGLMKEEYDVDGKTMYTSKRSVVENPNSGMKYEIGTNSDSDKVWVEEVKQETAKPKATPKNENPELGFAKNRFALVKGALDRDLAAYKKSGTQKDLDTFRKEVNKAIDNRRSESAALADPVNDPLALELRNQISELQNTYLLPVANEKGTTDTIDLEAIRRENARTVIAETSSKILITVGREEKTLQTLQTSSRNMNAAKTLLSMTSGAGVGLGMAAIAAGAGKNERAEASKNTIKRAEIAKGFLEDAKTEKDPQQKLRLVNQARRLVGMPDVDESYEVAVANNAPKPAPAPAPAAAPAKTLSPQNTINMPRAKQVVPQSPFAPSQTSQAPTSSVATAMPTPTNTPTSTPATPAPEATNEADAENKAAKQANRERRAERRAAKAEAAKSSPAEAKAPKESDEVTKKNFEKVGQEQMLEREMDKLKNATNKWGIIPTYGKLNGTNPYIYQKLKVTTRDTSGKKPIETTEERLYAFSPQGGYEVMNAKTGEWKQLGPKPEELSRMNALVSREQYATIVSKAKTESKALARNSRMESQLKYKDKKNFGPATFKPENDEWQDQNKGIAVALDNAKNGVAAAPQVASKNSKANPNTPARSPKAKRNTSNPIAGKNEVAIPKLSEQEEEAAEKIMMRLPPDRQKIGADQWKKSDLLILIDQYKDMSPEERKLLHLAFSNAFSNKNKELPKRYKNFDSLSVDEQQKILREIVEAVPDTAGTPNNPATGPNAKPATAPTKSAKAKPGTADATEEEPKGEPKTKGEALGRELTSALKAIETAKTREQKLEAIGNLIATALEYLRCLTNGEYKNAYSKDPSKVADTPEQKKVKDAHVRVASEVGKMPGDKPLSEKLTELEGKKKTELATIDTGLKQSTDKTKSLKEQGTELAKQKTNLETSRKAMKSDDPNAAKLDADIKQATDLIKANADEVTASEKRTADLVKDRERLQDDIKAIASIGESLKTALTLLKPVLDQLKTAKECEGYEIRMTPEGTIAIRFAKPSIEFGKKLTDMGGKADGDGILIDSAGLNPGTLAGGNSPTNGPNTNTPRPEDKIETDNLSAKDMSDVSTDTWNVLTEKIKRATANFKDTEEDLKEVKTSGNWFRTGIFSDSKEVEGKQQAVKEARKELSNLIALKSGLSTFLDTNGAPKGNLSTEQIKTIHDARKRLGLPDLPRDMVKNYDAFQKNVLEKRAGRDRSLEVDYAAINQTLKEAEASMDEIAKNLNTAIDTLDTAAMVGTMFVPGSIYLYSLAAAARDASTGRKTPEQAAIDLALMCIAGKVGGMAAQKFASSGSPLIAKFATKYAPLFTKSDKINVLCSKMATGAVAGGAMSGTDSAMRNTWAAGVTGEKTAGEAVTDTLWDAGKGAATGAVMGGVMHGVTTRQAKAAKNADPSKAPGFKVQGEAPPPAGSAKVEAPTPSATPSAVRKGNTLEMSTGEKVSAKRVDAKSHKISAKIDGKKTELTPREWQEMRKSGKIPDSVRDRMNPKTDAKAPNSKTEEAPKPAGSTSATAESSPSAPVNTATQQAAVNTTSASYRAGQLVGKTRIGKAYRERSARKEAAKNSDPSKATTSPAGSEAAVGKMPSSAPVTPNVVAEQAAVNTTNRAYKAGQWVGKTRLGKAYRERSARKQAAKEGRPKDVEVKTAKAKPTTAPSDQEIPLNNGEKLIVKKVSPDGQRVKIAVNGKDTVVTKMQLDQIRSEKIMPAEVRSRLGLSPAPNVPKPPTSKNAKNTPKAEAVPSGTFDHLKTQPKETMILAEFLGLPKTASRADMESAAKRIAGKLHADKVGDSPAISENYETANRIKKLLRAGGPIDGNTSIKEMRRIGSAVNSSQIQEQKWGRARSEITRKYRFSKGLNQNYEQVMNKGFAQGKFNLKADVDRMIRTAQTGDYNGWREQCSAMKQGLGKSGSYPRDMQTLQSIETELLKICPYDVRGSAAA